jgi:hypothetical protein
MNIRRYILLLIIVLISLPIVSLTKPKVIELYSIHPLPSKSHNYLIKNIFDNDLKTFWSEGNPDGLGSIHIKTDKQIKFNKLKIKNGSSANTFSRNNRIKKINLIYNQNINERIPLVIKDTLDYQIIDLNKTVNTDSIVLEILDIYKGSKWNDTCLSELKFMHNNNEIEFDISDISNVNFKSIHENSDILTWFAALHFLQIEKHKPYPIPFDGIKPVVDNNSYSYFEENEGIISTAQVNSNNSYLTISPDTGGYYSEEFRLLSKSANMNIILRNFRDHGGGNGSLYVYEANYTNLQLKDITKSVLNFSITDFIIGADFSTEDIGILKNVVTFQYSLKENNVLIQYNLLSLFYYPEIEKDNKDLFIKLSALLKT